MSFVPEKYQNPEKIDCAVKKNPSSVRKGFFKKIKTYKVAQMGIEATYEEFFSIYFDL